MTISAKDLVIYTTKSSEDYRVKMHDFLYFFTTGKKFKPVYQEFAEANDPEDPSIFKVAFNGMLGAFEKILENNNIQNNIALINYDKFKQIYESIPNKQGKDFADFSKAFTSALQVCSKHNNLQAVINNDGMQK